MKNKGKEEKKVKDFSSKISKFNFCFTIDKEVKEKLSLKNLLKSRLFGAVCYNNLKIQLIIAQNIHVDIIDDLLDFDITCSEIEVVLNQKSSVNYNFKILQIENLTKDDVFKVARSFRWIGSRKFTEKELYFKFVGENSFAKIRCYCKGNNDSVFNLRTIQHHQASNTKSDLKIKGAFLKDSKLICDSIIKIDKNLQKVEVEQFNKNLLLGCNSKVISIPKLEVKSDNVKCKHGVTVRRLDDSNVFYLQSRGIDFCSAKNILVNAFFVND